MMELKVFISQPMRNKTNEEIRLEREKIINKIKEQFIHNEITIIDSFIEDCPHEAKPLWFLGKSLQLLSEADLCVFSKDALDSDNRGCDMEYNACIRYGIDVYIMEE